MTAPKYDTPKDIIVPMSLFPNWQKLQHDGEDYTRVNVTPALATWLLEHWSYKRQRNIRNARILAYIRMIEDGDWRFRMEMNVGVLPDGTYYLLNGYHRLTAMTRVSNPQAFMPVRFTFLALKDQEEAADYYSVLDKNGTRSDADDIRAHNLSQQLGVSPDLLRAGTSSGALIMTDFTGGRSNSEKSALGRSSPARIRFLRDWAAELQAANDILKPVHDRVKKMFQRQAVLAVMLMTLKYVPDRAPEFWTKAAVGEWLRVGDPEMTLRNFLIANKVGATHEHLYARFVANCWNAFYRYEKMTRTQVHREGIQDPIVIDGTPYSRKNRENKRFERLEAQRARMSVAREAKQATKIPAPYMQDDDILPEE
jgi:hypothetical protein